jgi:hypothetical protein
LRNISSFDTLELLYRGVIYFDPVVDIVDVDCMIGFWCSGEVCKQFQENGENLLLARSLRFNNFKWDEQECLLALDDGVWAPGMNGERKITMHYFNRLETLNLTVSRLWYGRKPNIKEDREYCEKLVLGYLERRTIDDPEYKVPEVVIRRPERFQEFYNYLW